MPAKLEEISAVYLGEKFRFENPDGDVVIGEARNGHAEPITIKGQADIDELQPHLSYRFYGRWAEYTNKRTKQVEKQFHFQTFVRQAPHGRAGVIRYLCQAPHIGIQRATILWEKFGSDAVRILRESCDVAAAALGSQLNSVKAAEAAAWLEGEKAMEGCTIELIDLLGGRGFPKNTSREAVLAWGNRAAEFIRRSPYVLMNFRGCGFKKTDAMYLDLGLPPDALKRQAYCSWYSIASDTNGHTWFPVEYAIAGLKGQTKALRLAKRGRIIDTMRTDDKLFGEPMFVEQGGQLWIAEGKKARQERYVAQRVAELLSQPAQWPDISTLDGPKEHQISELSKALTKSIGILRGGPGTGKTYLTAALIKLCLKEVGADQVTVAAPTNKAAHRLTMALREHGASIEAKSIHRMLGVESAEGGWTFKHREQNPLPNKIVILDEGSMPSTDLMASVLAAIARGTMLLIVGDPQQLPPIQHGAPMRDMLASGCVPSGELIETHRNAGTIVQACDDIRRGVRFREAKEIRLDVEPPQNFQILNAVNPRDQIAKLLQLIEWAKQNGYDPIWDVQAMVAVNKRSEVSRKAINLLLQNELNSGGFTIPGNPFRVGDKVVCTDNGYFPCVDEHTSYANEDGKCFIANGEFGKVKEVEDKLVVVEFPHPDRLIKFPRGKAESTSDDDDGNEDRTDTGCSLDLAYGCTVHKMQGSEVAIAAPILDEYPGARRICRREWFFTSLSRGKVLTVAIGKRSTADSFCKKAALPERKTFLAELIKQEVAKI